MSPTAGLQHAGSVHSRLPRQTLNERRTSIDRGHLCKTNCAASAPLKRKREQHCQVVPEGADNLIDWAQSVGVKADKLEPAMFGGETNLSINVSAAHAASMMFHALTWAVWTWFDAAYAAECWVDAVALCLADSCWASLFVIYRLTAVTGCGAVPAVNLLQAIMICDAGLRGMAAKEPIASGDALVSIPRQAAILVTPGMGHPRQLMGHSVDAKLWKDSPW